MKNLLQITTQVDEPDLLRNLIEKLAIKRKNHRLSNVLPKPWNDIETSSVESYISGTLKMQISEDSIINMPFTSSYLFSCKRENLGGYKFHWAIGLN